MDEESMYDNSVPSKHSALDGLYSFVDEIGSGGFGKVKLAVHLLTNQNVAIKIIDKKAIGKDLPRVKTEIDALKALSHQNICRLYQYIETEDKVYIIMEHCSGGELFDYIVKKERLEESEARHFFRQLVQAVAYMHSMGFAHRDLKPENLLLTDELHLKLIDFGLCARPESGLSCTLATCCGSPAYAAPELLQGRRYFGNEADVWSMGVLLYTLLCGSLPFEDDDLSRLYKKILRGVYYEPDYLSDSSKELLRSLLQVVPKRRLTLEELIMHPWINKKYSQTLKWKSIYDKNVVDEEIIVELAHHLGLTTKIVEEMIKEWKFDYYTATYLILLQLKRKSIKFALPPCKISGAKTEMRRNLLSSPTIHASLDDELNKSGLDNDDFYEASSENLHDAVKIQGCDMNGNNDESFATAFTTPSITKKNIFLSTSIDQHSSTFGLLNTPVIYAGVIARQYKGSIIHRFVPSFSNSGLPSCVTPLRYYPRQKVNIGFDKNIYHRPCETTKDFLDSPKIQEPVMVIGDRPKSSLYASQTGTCKNILSDSRPHSLERSEVQVQVTPKFKIKNRLSRSAIKTPRLKQRVFASLERQADKMINLLTPKKVKNPSPNVLKQAKTMVNISITSSKNPEIVRCELLRVFNEQNIITEQHGWKLSGRKRDEFGRVMTVELEILMIELGNKEKLVGVKRKRLCGDAFLYKKVCEQVLQLAGL